MANAERQVVKRLQASGSIRVSYGRIDIVDEGALRDFAHGTREDPA